MAEQTVHKQASGTPYIVATVIIVVAFMALIFGILYIRPQVDVPTLLGAVGALATLVFGQAVLFIKQRETAIKVDGRLQELLDARSGKDRAEGAREGADVEQQRVAELKRVAALTGAAPGPSPVVAPTDAGQR